MNETELEIFDAVAMVLMVLPVHPLSFVRKYGGHPVGHSYFKARGGGVDVFFWVFFELYVI